MSNRIRLVSLVLAAAMLLPAQALGVPGEAKRSVKRAPVPTVASSADPAADVVPGEWIVAFDRAVDDRAKARIKEAGLRVKQVGRDRRQVLVVGDLSQTQAFARIAGLGGVDFAEPVRRYRAALVPTDAAYAMQWGLPKIGAPAAWESTTGTASVAIAVIDTGIDLTHSEFTGRLDLANDYDFANDDANAQDDHGHGTHVAGIAAAGMNNGSPVVGTAPNSTILPVKVLGSNGTGLTYDIADGIRYAADMGVEVINLSLEGALSGSVESAISYALAKNVVIVAAAGNGSGAPVSYPAAYPGVIAVSAVDSSLSLAGFSNVGEIDVAAPGVAIYSTGNGGGYEYMQGTSMASPFVAGVAALMRAVNPGLGQEEVVQRLKASTDDIGAAGEDSLYGSGFLNAARAVASASGLSNDDEVPGTMIPASPATGTLDSVNDTDDVFAVSLVAGEGLEVTMTLDPADDLDLRLFGPGTASVRTASPLVADTGSGSVRRVVHYAVTSGIYYLDARAQSGSGDYSIAYRVIPNDPADDDVPGVRIPASPVTGTLARLADDDDVYRVSLQRGDRLTATLTGAAGADFDLYLYPHTASTVLSMDWAVASMSEGDVPETVSYTALVPGDYLLDANAYSGAGAYTITWSVTRVTLAADDDVPGAPLPSATFTRGLAYESDLNDVYYVDLDVGQTLSAALSTPDALGLHDFDLHLYGPGAAHAAPPDIPVVSAKARVGYDTMYDTESLTYAAPVAGRYYLATRSYWGDGNYTLTWSRTAGPADGGIPGVSAESPVRRLLGVDGDLDDVFDVALDAGQQLRVSLAASGTSDFDLHLYGPDATSLANDTVAASYWRGNPESLTFIAPVGGTYRIDARRTSGAGLYTLEYSKGPAAASASSLSIESTQVPSASTATLTATLTTASGPVAGARLAFETYTNGAWQYAGAVSTGVDGRSSLAVTATTTRFRARHAGDLLTAAATSAPLDLPDVVPPVVTVSGVANGGQYSTAVTPVIGVSGHTSVSYRLDGAVYVPGTPIATEGARTLRVEARDAAGNLTAVEVGFTIDLTPPAITVGGVSDGADYSAPVTPTVTVGGAIASTITLDGAAFVSGSRVTTEGAHTLRVDARDAAGNTSTRVVTFGVHYPPLPTAAISVAATSVVLPYGGTWEMTGTLTADGAPLAERTVELWAADLSGIYFDTGRVAMTTADGSFSFGVAPDDAGYYAVRFAGDGSAAASPLSQGVRVTPAPLIGSPLAPSAVWRTKYFTVSGSIAPTHSAESTSARVYLYFKSGTTWLSKGSSPAVMSADGTSYSARIALSTAGSWKLTARHVADVAHADAWSPESAYVTVKDIYLTNPVAPATMSRSRYYRVYGTLNPRHTAGTSPVRIYRELKVGTRWVPKGYLTARVADYGPASSQYSRSLRLSAGKWRLYAYHPVDTAHPAKRSPSYDYVTVR